jgi:hypothetical protein
MLQTCCVRFITALVQLTPNWPSGRNMPSWSAISVKTEKTGAAPIPASYCRRKHWLVIDGKKALRFRSICISHLEAASNLRTLLFEGVRIQRSHCNDVIRMKESLLGHKTVGAARRIFSLTSDGTKRAICMSLRDLDQRCSLCPSDTDVTGDVRKFRSRSLKRRVLNRRKQ